MIRAAVPMVHRKRPPKVVPVRPTPPVSTLNLIAAILDTSGGDPLVTLTFDRAIDISAIDPSQITAFDYPNTGVSYGGYSLDGQPSAESVSILVEELSEAPVSPTSYLDATSSNGIVAAGDGAAWAGCEGLVLPFP